MADKQIIKDWILQLGFDTSLVSKGTKQVENMLVRLDRIERTSGQTRLHRTQNVLNAEKKITAEKRKQESVTTKRVRAETAIQNIERRAALGGLGGGSLEKVKNEAESLKAKLDRMTSPEDFAYLSRRIGSFSQRTSKAIKDNNAGIAQQNSLLNARTRIMDRLSVIERRADRGLTGNNRDLAFSQVAGMREKVGAATNAEAIRQLALQTRFLNEDTSKNIALQRQQQKAFTLGGFLTKSFTGSLMNLAKGFIGVYAAINLMASAYQTIREIDSLKASLLAASGSAEQAGEDFQFVLQTSKDLGVSLIAAAQGYKQIGAAGRQLNFTTEETKEFFLAATEASRAFGLSADRTQLVYLAFSQILSKGKVSQEELRRQMGEQLPGVMSIAARAMQVTTGELEKMIQKGISAEEFMPKFSAELRRTARDGGALAASMESITAAEQRMSSSFQEGMMVISESGFGKGMVRVWNAISRLISTLRPLWTFLGTTFGIIADTGALIVDTFTTVLSLFGAIMNIATWGLWDSLFTGVDRANDKLSTTQRIVLGLRAALNMATGGIRILLGYLVLLSERFRGIKWNGIMPAFDFDVKGFQAAVRRAEATATETSKSAVLTKATSKTTQINNTNHFHGSPAENAKQMEGMFQNWLSFE
jgi:tape measure domain-containing protein